MAYAFQNDEQKEQLAYARVDGVNASYRDLCNVCSNISGRRADKAIVYLEEALEKKRPIRYFRHNSKRGHLHELGGRKGGYPVKSVEIVLKVLINAVANANAKGLADCKVIHVCANKGLVYARMSPKGRRIRQDFETAFVEVVLRELQTEENLVKKEQMKKAREDAKRKAEEAAKKAAEKAAEAAKSKDAKKADEKVVDVESTSKDAKKADEKPADAKPTPVKETDVNKEEPKKEKRIEIKEASKKKMSDVLAQNKKDANHSKN